MMKKILSIILSLVLISTLSACQVTTPDESIETATHIDYDLALMTDEQLLCAIITRNVFQGYDPNSDYSVEELMIASPELKELLNRDTALESLKSLLPALAQANPGSGIDFLESYLDTIEAYLDPSSVTKIADMTNYELLRTMALGEDISHCMLSSYMTAHNQLSQLMSYSPAFTELVTRSTAVESINTYLEPLQKEFPNSCIEFVADYIPLIQEYQARTDCADLSKLDDLELIVRIIKNHEQIDWLTNEFFDEHYPLYTFMYLCPEFTELLTRSTALDSIKTYSMLSAYYPNPLAWLEPYFTDIESFITESK